MADVLSPALEKNDPRIAPRSPMRSGLSGAGVNVIGGGGGGDGGLGGPAIPSVSLACTVDWSLWTVDDIFQDADVSANRGDVWRKTGARVGFGETGQWIRVAYCVPFQHVASRIPQLAVEGLTVPAASSNTFRFPVNLGLEPEDVIFVRVGAQAGTYWSVSSGTSIHSPRAQIILADVERQVAPDAALLAVSLS